MFFKSYMNKKALEPEPQHYFVILYQCLITCCLLKRKCFFPGGKVGALSHLLWFLQLFRPLEDYKERICIIFRTSKTITIYAPLIYTAPCIMFYMRAYPLRGEVGGGWALEFESFLDPVNLASSCA